MIVSIDIGTSYCTACFVGPDGRLQNLELGTGASMFGTPYSLPSAIFVEEDGTVLVGQAAMNSRMRDPQRFRMEFKRELGSSIPIVLGQRRFLTEDIYTEIFRHIISRARAVSGEEIEEAYLTYPASYGRTKQELIKKAARAAGLFHIKMVDEPTAAAMSYCAAGYVKNGEKLLVYDFGGGTFDVSVIRYDGGEFIPLSEPDGLERCGGIDIDRMIYQDMLETVKKRQPELMLTLEKNPQHYIRFASQLSELAVKCKHHLSAADVFAEDIQVNFEMIPYRLTLDRFSQMIAPLVGQTIRKCREVLEAAGMGVDDLSSVLLVGGTSRIRLVREMVEKMAGKVTVHCAADVDMAVVQGALSFDLDAIQERIRKDREEAEKRAREEAEERKRIEIRERLILEMEEKKRIEEEKRRKEEEEARRKEEERLRAIEEERRQKEEAERIRREKEAEEWRIANTPLHEIKCKLKSSKQKGSLRLFRDRVEFAPESSGEKIVFPSVEIFFYDPNAIMRGEYKNWVIGWLVAALLCACTYLCWSGYFGFMLRFVDIGIAVNTLGKCAAGILGSIDLLLMLNLLCANAAVTLTVREVQGKKVHRKTYQLTHIPNKQKKDVLDYLKHNEEQVKVHKEQLRLEKEEKDRIHRDTMNCTVDGEEGKVFLDRERVVITVGKTETVLLHSAIDSVGYTPMMVGNYGKKIKMFFGIIVCLLVGFVASIGIGEGEFVLEAFVYGEFLFGLLPASVFGVIWANIKAEAVIAGKNATYTIGKLDGYDKARFMEYFREKLPEKLNEV